MHFVVEKKGFSFWDGTVEVFAAEVKWELGLNEALAALKQGAAGAPVEDREQFEAQVKEGDRDRADDLGQRVRPDHRGELDAAGEARQAELDKRAKAERKAAEEKGKSSQPASGSASTSSASTPSSTSSTAGSRK